LTQTFEDRIRFNNHDKAGAREAEHICRRLRMPREQMARIVWLVENHMRLAMADRMCESKLKRFVREEGFPELLELGRLDCLASHLGLDHIAWIEDYLSRLEPESVKPAPLLSGKDLIAMGYAPGPLFSEILSAVEDEQLEGRLDNAQAAVDFVQTRWPLST
jgi:poly(A) polymerase